MLLATSAFGAISLKVSPDSPITVDALTGNASITLSLDNPDGVNVWGVSLQLLGGADADKVRLVTRTNLSPTMTDPTTTDPNVNDKVIGGATADIGYTGAIGVGTAAASVPLMQLALRVEPAALANLATDPIDLTVRSFVFDVDFNQIDVPDVGVQLVPEPASMLLVAAGAAFFARRRRTA
jgi:hypothetical protein